MIIDAHIHISRYEGVAKSLQEALQLLLTDMDKNGVSHAIVIPDNLEGLDTIADLEQARKLIAGNDRFFLLGSPQILQRGSSELEKYKELIQNNTIKGLKFFTGHDDYFPTDDRCQPYYEMSQATNTPVVFHTGENTDHPEVARFNDPKYIVEVAKNYPNLKVIITHYFWPKMEYCYEITKSVPNIYFETAGMADAEVVEATGGLDKVREVLLKTINDREDQVIFGTDWPMCTYEEHINLIRSLKLPTLVENKIFSGNANKIYNLNLITE